MSLPEENVPVASGTSVVAPSGGAGQGLDAEQAAGTEAAQANAQAQEEARSRREDETLNAVDIASKRAAIGEKDFADKAERVRSMVEDLPPAGPGLPKVGKGVIAATMDPNNPVLNPDMSEVGRQRGLPPGAYVPAPVLPGDSVETQYATKPLTDEHAKEAEEVAKGLPEPIYPPAGSQPTIELTQAEREEAEQRRRDRPSDRLRSTEGGRRQIGQANEDQQYATDALAQKP